MCSLVPDGLVFSMKLMSHFSLHIRMTRRFSLWLKFTVFLGLFLVRCFSVEFKIDVNFLMFLDERCLARWVHTYIRYLTTIFI